VQDEVNQDYSEQNEVDGMKKGADFTVSTATRKQRKIKQKKLKQS